MIITLVKTLKQKHPKYTSAWAKSIAKVGQPPYFSVANGVLHPEVELN
jgi:hypothetical protein